MNGEDEENVPNEVVVVVVEVEEKCERAHFATYTMHITMHEIMEKCEEKKQTKTPIAHIFHIHLYR